MERTPNKSRHTKLTLEKKILPPPLLPGFELATFRSRVRRSIQRAIPALHAMCDYNNNDNNHALFATQTVCTPVANSFQTEERSADLNLPSPNFDLRADSPYCVVPVSRCFGKLAIFQRLGRVGLLNSLAPFLARIQFFFFFFNLECETFNL